MTYEEFEKQILQLTGVDLSLYKENQMKRRINALIEKLKLDGYESHLELLRGDKNSLDAFLDYITINVTEFFRSQEQWNAMADTVVPELPDDAVIWSCACSTGDEAYSLAISIAERRPLANIRIIATDIDDKVLEIAKRGEYSLRNMGNVYDENVDKYFTKTLKGYRVCDEIRSHVEFRKLNLLADDFPQNCNLILCRNVLIYFTEEVHSRLYRRFSDSLCPGGYLFTGNAEQIIRFRDYDFTKVNRFLYKKNTPCSGEHGILKQSY